MSDDFTSRELFKHGLREQSLNNSISQRHSNHLEEVEKKHDLDLEKQREKLAHDKELYAEKREDKYEDIEHNHQLAKIRQQEKNILDQRQKEIDHQMKYKELYLKAKVDYSSHENQLDHNIEISGKEHKHRLKEKRQDLQNEVTILNGKYQGDLALARQEMNRDLRLQREKIRSDLELMETQADYELEQAELIGKMEYKKALNIEYEISSRAISIEEEQTKRALTLAREQQDYELALAYTKHLTLLEEKKLDLINDVQRIEAETNAYQEKEDADLDRRFLEGKEQLNHELIRYQAEFVKMTHANNLQKDLETHRFNLMKQSGVIDKNKVSEYIAELEKEFSEFND
jgi:hypothetical protein